MSGQRLILVGDVHGCLEEFDELLREVEFVQGSDRLVLLGDLMDRGPDGVGVVRRARQLRVECTMGNHDWNHIRWRRHEEARKLTGVKNPMRSIAKDRRIENEALTDDDIAWLSSLPTVIHLGNNWVAAHGGFEPNVPLYKQKEERILKMRFLHKETLKPLPASMDFTDPPDAVFWAHEWTGPENVVYGHAVHGDYPLHTRIPVNPPFESLRESWPSEVQTLGLDTGCCFGGKLSCAVSTDNMNTWEIVQVAAKRVYRHVPGGVKTMAGRAPLPEARLEE